MSDGSDFKPGGFGIVITDLFVSATAVLLLVLAVARPTPPQALPIQADLLAGCSPSSVTGSESETPIAVFHANGGNSSPGEGIPVKSAEEMSLVPGLLGLPARLFYSIAIVGQPDAPVTADCLERVSRQLVRAHNEALTIGATGADAPRPIFAVSLGLDGHGPNEAPR